VAGGTNLVDLMRLGMIAPGVLVDVRRLTPAGSRSCPAGHRGSARL
jgi:CO/xanthine dehydrogenase FAD-binding subunit